MNVESSQRDRGPEVEASQMEQDKLSSLRRELMEST